MDIESARHFLRTGELKVSVGECWICRQPETVLKRRHKDGRARNEKRLAVDHCHDTDRFRGLVCQRCNQMLGYARDNPDVLRRAAAYLEQSDALEGFTGCPLSFTGWLMLQRSRSDAVGDVARDVAEDSSWPNPKTLTQALRHLGDRNACSEAEDAMKRA